MGKYICNFREIQIHLPDSNLRAWKTISKVSLLNNFPTLGNTLIVIESNKDYIVRPLTGFNFNMTSGENVELQPDTLDPLRMLWVQFNTGGPFYLCGSVPVTSIG